MIDLSSLNSEQLEAVKDTENNLLILACAGSGKTRTITAKIAYEIESGIVKPWEVCAVTFTNRAAKEMRDRVASILPDVDTTRMVLRTFHSLGATLLRRFSSAASLSPDFSIYDDDDSLQLFASAMERAGRRMDRKELREELKDIAKAKDLGYTPSTSEKTLREVSSSPFFSDSFRIYQEALESTGNVDFADLIQKSVRILRDDECVREYCHRRFRLVLVDEYQDSNREQFNFLRYFVGPETRLVVVGDDDQSIYSFRGAEVRNILSFSSSFQGVREIKLEKNYRSTDQILAPAAALIRKNKERHQKEIVSADGKTGPRPAVLCSMSGIMEAKRITNIIAGDGRYGSTAVLYRTNAQSSVFESEFTKARIPYKVVGALRFYEREEVKDGIAFLRLLLNHRDRVSWSRIINKPARGIGDKAQEEILSISDDIMEAMEKYVENASGKARGGAVTFLDAWKKAEKELDRDTNPGAVLNNGLRGTGIHEYYMAEKDEAQKRSRMENLSQLVSALSTEEDEDILAEIETEKEGQRARQALRRFLETVTLDTTVIGTDDPRDREGVTLITMHNTKGLEYDRVFCVGLEEALIPGRNVEDKAKKEEERRILYVAMTRARKTLYLSYARSRLMWGHSEHTSPSPFLFEIPERFLSGDTGMLFRNTSSFQEYSSSSSSYSSGYGYKSDYTASWRKKETTSVSNTPSWAKDLGGLKEKSAPKIASAPERETGFCVGDKVSHEVKGIGEVTERVTRADGKTIVTVVFPGERQMKFVEGHAAIRKI